MGTRGLLGFIFAAQRHATYNHFDSYPDALGQDIVKFILSLNGPDDYAEMDRLVRALKWVESGSNPSINLQRKYAEAGFSNLEVGDQGLANWNNLLHKVQGAHALPAIQSGRLDHLPESISFLEDGLFCEWAYFIDFENQKLETWSGGSQVDEVTFERLIEEGEAYMTSLDSED